MSPQPVEGPRGGSFYDDPAVLARYREHRGDGIASPNEVMELPAVRRELGGVAGLRVLDLGCGDGTFGRELLTGGCRSYLGTDGSRAMVELARAALVGTAGQVQLADLEDLAVEPGSVDLVVSRLALHYVRDLAPVLATCSRALVPGGRLLVTVVHPVITSSTGDGPEQPRTSWLVDDYFLPGPRHRAWLGGTVTWFHRTVEQYVQAVADAGFRLTALRECEPEAALFPGADEELARRRRVPLFLLLAAGRDR